MVWYANGQAPRSALYFSKNTSYPVPFRPDVGKSLDRLIARMWRMGIIPLGVKPIVTDGYRDYATQVRLKAEKGRLAATPGTSKHGSWDLGAFDGAYSHTHGMARYVANNRPLSKEYGWFTPSWAEDGRGIEEPWHKEYNPAWDQHAGEATAGDGEGETEVFTKGTKNQANASVQGLLNFVLETFHVLRDYPGGRWLNQGLGLVVDGAYGKATARLVHYLKYKVLKQPKDKSPGRELTTAELLHMVVLAIALRQRANSIRDQVQS